MERGREQYSVVTFELRRSMFRPSKIDVSTFGDRCVDLRRSILRPSKIPDGAEYRLNIRRGKADQLGDARVGPV